MIAVVRINGTRIRFDRENFGHAKINLRARGLADMMCTPLAAFELIIIGVGELANLIGGGLPRPARHLSFIAAAAFTG